ncbi:hypothetical protein [Sutcliffiella cohnii]|uniref:hypothetical protein n=1 Tax=Sutcliffiella cohnii TaxID=33932 RepID=UPI000832967E|nr:hypothetical protein [Sutcliffiella cohnii]
MINSKKSVIVLLAFIIGLIYFIFEPQTSYAADDPYSVPSSVRNNWDNTYGSKIFDMRTGRRLVYDVYSEKYISGGYRITNQDFGNGRQPYLNFSGWAVIMGHKAHTSTNNETYIVAQKVGSGSTTKIYSTLTRNLSATEDLEYNNQGSGVWNECPSGATNKSNVPAEDNGCNMRYNSVGFNAYIPLNELFPDPTEASSWRLYIVKRVDSHIVYSELILPFDFDSRSFNGGEISLTSGVNANNLVMTSNVVIRRTSPRSTESSAQRGYFDKDRTYRRVTVDEQNTAVWYGVRSPHDSNNTRWASTAYWIFGGDQAVIRFTGDTTPPEHIQHSLTNHRYKNNNDYWVQPNDSVNIRLRGTDQDSPIERTNLQLSGSATARVRHFYGTSASGYDYYTSSSHVNVTSGQRTHQSGDRKTREATFGIAPKTHGHSYDISAYHRDAAGNNSGWVNTNMRLRVDGVNPVHIHQNISGERYREGNNYWIRPSDVVQVAIRGRDLDSGLNNTMISIGSSNNRITGMHEFSGSNTNLTRPINTTTEMTLVSANRTYTSGNIREVTFDVRGNTHGASHAIRHRYEDNVNNISDGDGSGWSDFEKYVKVDGEAPIRVSETINGHRYKDTNNVHWIRPGETLEITQRGKDTDSGLEQTRLSTGEGSNRNIARHNFSSSTTNITITNNSTDFDVLSANRTYNSTETKEVTYVVRGNTHGSTHSIRSYYKDNVGNESTGDTNGWNTATNTIGVDGEGPNVSFRNEQDSANFLNREWDNTDIKVRLKLNDNESGYKQSRYVWTTSTGKPSESEWSNWTTNSNYVVSTTGFGQWYLHIQAEDNVGNITSTYSGPYKFNNPPVADFNWNPETIYNDVNVSFNNLSSDKDGQILGYQWSYQQPNSSSWVNFSSEINPSRVFNIKGTWNIRLTASDGITSHSVTKSLIVQNRPPKAGFTFDKSVYYIGDDMLITSVATDPDGDDLKYYYEVTDPNGGLTIFDTPDFTYRPMIPGEYTFYQRVTDSDEESATDSVTAVVTIRDLTLTGKVLHTQEWQERHEKEGNQPHEFYSGEVFVLEADITDYPVEYVTVDFEGEQINGNIYTKSIILYYDSPGLFKGELYEPEFSKEGTLLKNGPIKFSFTVKYTNGIIKTDVVHPEIIDSVWNYLNLHRRY